MPGVTEKVFGPFSPENGDSGDDGSDDDEDDDYNDIGNGDDDDDDDGWMLNRIYAWCFRSKPIFEMEPEIVTSVLTQVLS